MCVLYPLGKLVPIIRDNKVIKLIFTYTLNGNTAKLIFIDSFQLLPASLDQLAKSFNSEEQKFSLDHTKVSLNNLEELTNYCEQDCKALYSIVSKFSDLIFDNWSINIGKYPTISSLFIYKTHFYLLIPFR